MDKKNTTIGVLLLIAAFVSLRLAPRPAPSVPSAAPVPELVKPAVPGPLAPNQAAQPAPAAMAVPSPVSSDFASLAPTPASAQTVTLGNEFITAHFTEFGGALSDVELRKYPAVITSDKPFDFNAEHSDPMLGFVNFPGLDRSTPYELVSHTATEVVYRAVFNGQFEVTRRYTIVPQSTSKQDPYQLRHETTFRNLTDQPLALSRIELSLGTAVPLNSSIYGRLVTTGYSDGKSQNFVPTTKLGQSGGLFGLGAHAAVPAISNDGPVVWAAVDNQFFTSILTPDKPGSGLITRRVLVQPKLPETDPEAFGITGSVQFDVPPLAAHGSTTLGLDFYVGAKEYKRLANPEIFKADQDKIMQYGLFKFFSQLLITLMIWMHTFLPNWGFAIVLTTLTIKTVFLPLTLKASRSMKRMQKFQPEIQALREKYKDNPQKAQTAMMELYKEHKINPLGGCIPMLLPLPFFYGFYRMLANAAELRFQPFLWAHDLSAPDTVAHVLGYPLNILPLLMGVTMIFQATLTPAPTVDNAQARMMKFMPLVFVIFCYNYSCALSLYFFINNLFSIIQQLIINRMKDVEPVAVAATGKKPLKNVTPKRK